MQHTNISDVGVDSLASLTGLKELWISGTKITRKGAKELRRQMPSTNIYR